VALAETETRFSSQPRLLFLTNYRPTDKTFQGDVASNIIYTHRVDKMANSAQLSSTWQRNSLEPMQVKITTKD